MKKNLTQLLLSLIISLIPGATMAQFVCETVTSAKNASEEEAFNAYVLEFRERGGHLDTSIKYIPTVVHIIMKSHEDTISMERVIDQIEQTNLHMRRQNPDTVNTREMFRAVAADTHIELCLATIKPDGEEFEGVLWHYLPDKSTEELEKHLETLFFDKDKYLNIWVRPDIWAASATFPWMKHQPDDGITISHRLFGYDPIGGDPLHQEGKILTHELGHYLGLYHTFHNGHMFLGDCDFPHCDTITDRCCDTPIDWSFFPLPGDECNFAPKHCPDGYIFYTQNENYMFYNPDWCLNMFSYDQRTRMRATLNSIRANLCSAENLLVTGASCNPATVIRPPEKTQQVRIYPNPANDVIHLDYGNLHSMPKQITVYNMLGKAVIQKTGTSIDTVDMNGLPTGLYLVRVRMGEMIFTEKVLKQ